MNISAHITLGEATRSNAAIRRGIPNTPNPEQLNNMKLFAEKVFEPLREYISKKRGKDTPIRINSFFRSPQVNKLIKGSKTSQHCKGEAADIETNYPDFTNKDLFLTIKERGVFDQLIWEFGDSNAPAWVHVSYSKSGNRKQVLKAVSENGRTVYKPFT